MIERAAHRVNWTIKIEMHVPTARLAFLIKKMQHSFAAVLFVKTTGGVLVVCEAARKVAAPR
jgi:hypothetical protein